MIKKIIHIISIISLIILTFLIIGMLPLIFRTSWQGILLLMLIFLLLIVEVFIIIKKEESKKINNDIYIILITVYFSIFYYNVYSTYIKLIDFDYDIKISYCKQNYLMISLLIFLLIINILKPKYKTKK